MTGKTSCFIRKGNRVYCGGCGKPQRQDRYNLLKHGEECGFASRREPPILEEGKDYAYRFEESEDRETLIFQVSVPYLLPTRVYPDRYCGTRWEEVFRAEFSRGSRTVRETGLYNIDVWMKRMLDQQHLPSVTGEDDLSVLTRFFPDLLAISSYGAFLDIYRNKGYGKEELLPERKARNLLARPLSPSALPAPGSAKVPDCTKETEMRPEVIVQGEWIRYQGTGYLQLQILPGPGGEEEREIRKLFADPLSLLLAEGYARASRLCSEEIRYLLLTPRLKVENQVSPYALRQFDKAYPAFLLQRYLESGGKNLLIPLLSANYNKCMELLYKAGMPEFAETYSDLKKNNELVLYRNNLPEIFGLPVKTLRRIATFGFSQEEGIFARLREIYDYNPRYLSLSRYGISALQFLKWQNITRNPNFFGNYLTIRQMNSWTDEELFRTLKYCNQLDGEIEKRYEDGYQSKWRMYKDYVETCCALGDFQDGKWPKDLRAAHDRAAERYYILTNEKLRLGFLQAVTGEKYLSLTTDWEEDQEAFEKDPYCVLAPHLMSDLDLESKEMHNCVKTYIDAVAKGNTMVFFLRKKTTPDRSLCTMEVTKDKVLIQVKAFANTKPAPKIRAFVRKWAKIKGVQIRTYDML